MLNCSTSLAMSTSILKALPGKLDIKINSPSILFVTVSSFFLLFGVLAYICHLGKSHGPLMVTGRNLSWTVALVIIRNKITFIFIFLLGKFQRNQKKWSVDSHQRTEAHKDLGHLQELLKYLFCQTCFPICVYMLSRVDLI